MTSLVIETNRDSEYMSFPVSYGILHFTVETSSDVNLLLTSVKDRSEPAVGFTIGFQDNSETAIIKNGEIVRTKITNGILDEDKPKGFWIKWDNGLYQFGVQGQYKELLAYHDTESFPINYVGVTSKNLAIWSLEINESSQPEACELIPCVPKWILAENSRIPIPENAFVAGYENGQNLTIGRASYYEALTPGKIYDERLYIAWGGSELSSAVYEVLCDCNGKFVSMKNTDPLPQYAFIAGAENGHYMYIARVFHEGQVILGKFYPHYGMAYIPYKGLEIEFTEFEILVCNILNPENFDYINSSISTDFEQSGPNPNNR